MDYFSILLLLLVLFQIKHWYVDFVNQTDTEVVNKGIYLKWLGLRHSIKHGIGTFLLLIPFTSLNGVLIISLIDALLHYHIDWFKMNWGNRDIRTPQFWQHLGLDQMLHQLSYILYIYLLLGFQWLNI